MKANSKQTSRSESDKPNAGPANGNVLPLRRIVRMHDVSQTADVPSHDPPEGDDGNPGPTAA
jgi:hypothetical protein